MKTRAQIESMSREERRVATAELCGYERLRGDPYNAHMAWMPKGLTIKEFIAMGEPSLIDEQLPDYLQCLNACAAARQSLNYMQKIDYAIALASVLRTRIPAYEEYTYKMIDAKAIDHNTAFLMVMLP